MPIGIRYIRKLNAGKARHLCSRDDVLLFETPVDPI